MEKGICNLGGHMKYLHEKANTIANNIANSDTVGFKKDMIFGKGFNSILSDKTKDSATSAILNVNQQPYQGVYIEQVYTSFIKGSIVETGQNKDLAISGDGFLIVSTDGNEKYLPCASTNVDKEGFLSVPTKGRIKGIHGDIPIGFNEYTIKRDGTVLVDGLVVDKIKVVDFVDKKLLVKGGDHTFTTVKENIIEKENANILQGYLEASNVDMTSEMTELIEVSREYETSQRTVQILDEIYGVAINKVGKV